MTEQCEFCDNVLPEGPANVALLKHVSRSPDCAEQYHYLLENLRASWTPAMSGG